MSVSRRRFLTSGALVSAAFLFKSGTTALGNTSTFEIAGNGAAQGHPVHSYSRKMFEPYIGDIFRVRVGKQTVDLKLVALTDVAPAESDITTRKTARTDCFSMRFHAVKSLPSAASNRELQHAKLGAFELFMTQSTDGRSFVHTAIVNHLI